MNQSPFFFAAVWIVVQLSSFSPIHAQQTLWGMTKYGGASSVGSIYRLNLGTLNLVEEYSFSTQNPGIHPNGAMEVGVDGKLYGLTREGGLYNAGVIFRVSPSGANYEVLHDFDVESGHIPFGELLLASDSLLYGLTSTGGKWNNGVLFSFDPVNLLYTVEANLADHGAIRSKGGLLQASNGKLYGLDYIGNTIFSWDIAQDSWDVVADLDTTIASWPMGTLAEASNGKLYGFFEQGGSAGFGGVFSWDLTTQEIIIHHSFPSSYLSSTYPSHQLVELDGAMYGTTFSSGPGGRGTIFSLDLLSGAYSLVHDFDGEAIERPNAGLIHHNGLLYGTTWVSPGFNDLGSIFAYDLSDSLAPIKVLHSFHSSKIQGITPLGNLTRIGSKLFGTTTSSLNAHGTFYSYDLQDSTFDRKLDFSYLEEGGYPVGGLAEGPDGLWYGMTQFGGGEEGGSIFSFNPQTQTLSSRYTFTFLEGKEPNGSLIFASDGMAYGMNWHRSSFDDGTLFRFDPLEDTLAVLHMFNKQIDGENPHGYLAEGTDGKLYGITAGASILFSFDLDSNELTVLHQFVDSTGTYPAPGLQFATDGHLYGATATGGAFGFGVLYQYRLDDSSFTPLHHFSGQDGRLANGCPIEFAPGKLAGMTASGGGNGNGSLYQYDLSTNVFTKWYDFEQSSGIAPYGELVVAEKDKLYGVVSKGINGFGGIFRFDPSDSSYTVLAAFEESVGNGLFQLNSPASYLLVQGFSTAIDAAIPEPEPDWEIFPNPTADHLYLSLDLEKPSNAEVQLINMQGQVILQRHFSFSYGQNQQKLNVSSLAEGMYILYLKMGKRTLSRKVLVSNK